MTFKIIKKLGQGIHGVTYLVKCKGELYALKRQKILPEEEEENFKYDIWREIELGKFINALSAAKQLFFMRLHDYKIIKCPKSYKHNVNPALLDNNPNFEKKVKERAGSKICLDKLLDYKGNSLEDILNNIEINIKVSLKDKYLLIIQVLYALDIMRQDGYIHNDAHAGNITYTVHKEPVTILIYDKPIKVNIVYSLIDYGGIKHTKFCIDDKETIRYKTRFKINSDAILFFSALFIQITTMMTYYLRKKYPIPPPVGSSEFNDIVKQFYQHNNYQTWNKIKKIIIMAKAYSDNNNTSAEEWFARYETTQEVKKEDSFMVYEIEMLFSALERRDFINISGFDKCPFIDNFIPDVEDTIFIASNILDNKKIMNYFMDKIT